MGIHYKRVWGYGKGYGTVILQGQRDGAMSGNEQRPYRAYLVRLWQEEDGVWRGTVENPHTGEKRAFASVEWALAHIRQEVQQAEQDKREG
jgi:hypothetical protein